MSHAHGALASDPGLGLAIALTLAWVPRAWQLRLGKPRERQEHPGLLPICPVLLAVEADQIPLFELQGDEDVRGRRDGKQKVPEGHRRGRPEGEEKPEHDGVADIAIEPAES